MTWGVDEKILVVCTGNVCRSVYAAQLMSQALNQIGVIIDSAGTDPIADSEPCWLAQDRLQHNGLPPAHNIAKELTVEQIETSTLILTASKRQRGVVAQLVPEARSKTFTIIEASLVAEHWLKENKAPRTLREWVEVINTHRCRVPMPTRPEKTGVLSSLRSKHDVVAISIPDGHNSYKLREHLATLDSTHKRIASLLMSFSRSWE
ncbi:MAG: hypothetical protein CSA83_02610 [Actinomycetales bacterium]|nr:MAG: hypothetical protein CSA83_02610 [Actinomycetales bacterium]